MEYPTNLTEKEQLWFDIIQECRTSGLSDSQWLDEHNLSRASFYYYVKQLRNKACEVPENQRTLSARNKQEVVPLFVEDMVPADNTFARISDSKNAASDIRITLHGISIEISNSASQEIIQNTILALQALC